MMLDLICLVATCVSAWAFVSILMCWIMEADVATMQRFMMIGGFYGYAALHIGGYV